MPIETVRRIAEQLLPRGGGRWWNEALMDLGSLVCTKRSPRCTECPLRRRCQSAGMLQPAEQQAKEEPCYRNVPRRLWRGRLVELLRQRSSCTLAEIAELLFGSAAADDVAWLRNLADQMASDGVVCRDGERLELPP
jgi:A/G-specific adenine glycosylase